MTYRLAWDRPFNENVARALAAQLCEYACNGSVGRPERGDPVYDAVTEKRDTTSVYSSCADLGHWMLFRLGVREYFINRAEHRGFKYGVNLSRLAWCAFAQDATASDRYSPGDILIIWSRPDTKDAHVTVVLRDGRTESGGSTANEIETANYGAPGGVIKTSLITYGSSVAGKPVAKLGSRLIRRWIPLGKSLAQLQANGTLVDAEDVTRDSGGSPIWRPNRDK